MRSLNRLKWLHAFEATARHGSFTGAARELGVTPAAVGQLVRALEDWVGTIRCCTVPVAVKSVSPW
ncbi:LysR family transcriptional regulator [Klebsiella michiganensis]|nr:LysR family transcriptional regulator [Klebsiella michiganensis]